MIFIDLCVDCCRNGGVVFMFFVFFFIWRGLGCFFDYDLVICWCDVRVDVKSVGLSDGLLFEKWESECWKCFYG